MKVQELRDHLKSADREWVEKAFAECYKCLPKSKKEEMDDILLQILAGTEKKKLEKKAVDFDALEREIQIFLDNAYAQNYFAPNRVIPKSQRPKWRFLVKNYIKELEKIPAESENYSRMLKLLRDLYCMLCYGCSYYIFSTEDAFRSVGWKQEELFHMLVKKTLSPGYSKEAVKQLLVDACGGGLSRESLHVYQLLVLLVELKTSDVKYMTIEVSKELAAERTAKLKTMKPHAHGSYDLREEINNLSGMVLMLSLSLAELEEGVRYFFANCREPNQEIVLYRALDFTEYVGDDRQWMQVYEYGIKKKISPREYLQDKYEKLKLEESEN